MHGKITQNISTTYLKIDTVYSARSKLLLKSDARAYHSQSHSISSAVHLRRIVRAFAMHILFNPFIKTRKRFPPSEIENGVSNSGGGKTTKLPQSIQNAKMAWRRVTRCQRGVRNWLSWAPTVRWYARLWKILKGTVHWKLWHVLTKRSEVFIFVCELLLFLSWIRIADCGAICSRQVTSIWDRITCRRCRLR